MATRRLSIAASEQLKDVTEAVGAATAAKSVELTWDLANVKQGNTKPLSKEDVLKALQYFTDYVIALKWPPA